MADVTNMRVGDNDGAKLLKLTAATVSDDAVHAVLCRIVGFPLTCGVALMAGLPQDRTGRKARKLLRTWIARSGGFKTR